MGLTSHFSKSVKLLLLRTIFLSLLIFIATIHVEAQNRLPADTVILSLQDAEKLFLERNFELLAANIQINEADAAIIQAKLWDNPNLNIEQGVYNPVTKNWSDVTATGETAVTIQQLIYLAGKRNKRITIGKVNSDIARYQFYDLQRTLRYELRTSFLNCIFWNNPSLLTGRLRPQKNLWMLIAWNIRKEMFPSMILVCFQSVG